MAHRILGYLLPPKVEQRLQKHCRRLGDDPVDVVADAVTLHFDALDGDIPGLTVPTDQLELPLGAQAS